MRKTLFVLTLGLAAMPMLASAQQSPVGKWRTLDDETRKPMTVVEVYEAQNGTLAAKIVENIAAPPTCTKCSGKDKGKSIIGMPVLWNLKNKNGVWGDGNGLKPSTGDTFRAKSVVVTDGGRKLEVTGCKAIFCRTATWLRN
ncbi:DUF2147 domain-containing protein [Lysobacter pythonis]|uniref:DUF2147 domain-containing protein n=1 Tax=Solilutibacter pythonis TaxID=2483112 RepID=A0A3M2HTC8_9GAMM|nr:DUF2147 domain-containing protein [Lysobacter pythonis]RMH93001.1 DUF2147 domain-containing protein [Lysobacter pythonis]